MWPFKKPPARVLLVKDYQYIGKDTDLRNVSKLGALHVVARYSRDFDGRDVVILEPGGVARGGLPGMSWEKIDDIPGLTDREPA